MSVTKRAVLSLLLALASPAARADEVAPARAHFEAGVRAYKGGDFATAISEYKTSLELAPKSGTLYALAQAYRANGDLDLAIYAYQEFLRRQPEGVHAKEYREVAAAEIRELEAKLREAKRRTQAAPPVHNGGDPGRLAVSEPHQPSTSGPTKEPTASLPSATSASPASAPAPSKPPIPPPLIVDTPTPKPPLRPWYKSEAGWALGTVGLVTLAIGGGLIAHAYDVDGQLQHSTSLAQERGLESGRDTYRSASYAMFAIGGAATAAGVIVFSVIGANAQSTKRSRTVVQSMLLLPERSGGLVTFGGVW